MRSASSSTQHLAGVQRDHLVLLDVVDQAAGRGDDHVAAGLQLLRAACRSRRRRRPARTSGRGRGRTSPRPCGSGSRARASARGSARADRSGLRSASAGRVSRRFITVTRKARVLPVPVCAWPATSRPASAIGRVSAWIGVQRVNPAASSPGEQRRMQVEGGKSDIGQGLVGHGWAGLGSATVGAHAHACLYEWEAATQTAGNGSGAGRSRTASRLEPRDASPKFNIPPSHAVGPSPAGRHSRRRRTP